MRFPAAGYFLQRYDFFLYCNKKCSYYSGNMCTFAHGNKELKIRVTAMDKSELGHILDHPAGITSAQVEALRRERDEHPYSAPLQVLALMADKMGGTPLWESQQSRVALYMMDAGRLDSLLTAKSQKPTTNNPQPIANSQPKVGDRQWSQQPTVNSQEPTANEGDFDILKEINAYQEVSFKTAPKSVILSNFLEKDGGIRLDEASFEAVPVQELAKKSIQPSGTLETETMAIMLVRQGKIEPAVAIYRKLISKYPEKSSIFAARIAEAESLRKQ